MLQPLNIAGSKVSGIVVSIPPAAELTGRVEIDDPSVRLTGAVSLQSDRIRGQSGSSAGPSGDFRIQGLVSSESYTMNVSRIPPVAYVAAVFQGTQEIPNAPYAIYGGGDPIRILLKTDGGVVQGAASRNGQGVARAFIVLAPKDRKLEQNFRTVVAAEDGTFRISAIAPGEYDLLALDRNEDDDYLDETFLQTVMERSVRIEVNPRSSQTIEVPLQYIPRR
jgi:hypothetical protein